MGRNQILSPSTDQYFTDSFVPGIMPNRITLQAQAATDFERYGNNAHALHSSLIQSVPPRPGENPVIYIFPAWPKQWDADFKLAARGAFLVAASFEKGEIRFVEIESQAGGTCRIDNPWPGEELGLYRNGKKVRDVSGTLLSISTSKGEVFTLLPKGSEPRE